MAKQYSTIEEAQKDIIELEKKNAALENERNTFKTKNTELEEDLRKVRELNQEYFNELRQQYGKKDDEDDKEDDEIESTEDFAAKLEI